MSAPGKLNGLTDVEGILVGSFTDRTAASGVTVVLCPEGTVAAVDVRGAAPGTRETDLLEPVNLVQTVQAVVLAGGSVYGLASADGVVRWLAERGRGFPLTMTATSHLSCQRPSFTTSAAGPRFVPPVDAEWGRRPARPPTTGRSRWAASAPGTGAAAGSIKGGLGTASRRSGVRDHRGRAGGRQPGRVGRQPGHRPALGNRPGARRGIRGWRAGARCGCRPGRRRHRHATPRIGVVATDAALTRVQALKVAQMAHDGLARAVRPAHTLFDGDTIFALAIGRRPLPETAGFFSAAQAQAVTDIGHAAADCVARAIVHAVLRATSAAGLTAYGDLPARARHRRARGV